MTNTVLLLLLMIAIIIVVDLLFFRNRFWARLIANVGIVVVFLAVYLIFFR